MAAGGMRYNVAASNVFNMDDLVCNLENSSHRRPKKNEYYQNEVLTRDELLDHHEEIISDVHSVLKCSRATVCFLLHHFKWDKEQLLEMYFDSNAEQFFESVNVSNPFTEQLTSNGVKLIRNQSIECEICFSSSTDSAGLGCGHRFCLKCWWQYLRTQIMSEGQCYSIRCAAAGCKNLMDEDTVINLVPDGSLRGKYQQLIINTFVTSNPLMRWCPGVNCEYIVKIPDVKRSVVKDWRPVTCKCTLLFCFTCGEDWHGPVKCAWLKKWLTKQREVETSDWIAVNTKDCPRCRVPIEKSGGCNHMVCANRGCGYNFCWECLGDRCPHGGQCLRANETQSQVAQNMKPAESGRYLDYYKCYTNHKLALKTDKMLYTSLRNKMAEMQHHRISCLKTAVDILCQCRQTLIYTYVFAYFLKRNDQAVILEEYQKDMESATEKLSDYLTRIVDFENLVEIKRRVDILYQDCENGLNALLHHVRDGYDFDLWEYDNLS